MRSLRRVGLVIHPRRDTWQVADQVEALLIEHSIAVVAGSPAAPDLDAVIVLGGDGLLMRTACDYAPYDCPVLGINLGNLGFLTAAERASALPAVSALITNDYRVEERMMLEASAPWMLPGSKVLALNDIVFTSGTKMANFDVRIASRTLSFRCDGIIIATSTGSTAYNASAFGPIINPAVDCIIVNIRYPQPLPFPPVVVHPTRSLEVSVAEGSSVVMTPDGRADLPVEGQAQVTIGASAMRAKLVRLRHNDFYDTLNEKFNLPLRTGTLR